MPLNPFTPKISIILLNFLPYNSVNVNLENLVLDQPIFPLLMFFFILINCLLDIVSIPWGEGEWELES